MPVTSYNPGDNFYDPYGDPWNTDPTSPLNNRWWLNPAWIQGGMNPPNFGTSGPGGGPPQQPPPQPPPAEPPMPEPQPPAEQPQQPNEGQVSETPQNPTVDESGNPTWSTDVWGNNIPLGEVGFGAGLGAGLAGLAGMGGGGSTPPNFSVTGTGQAPQVPPDFSVTGWGDPNNPTTGDYHTYFDIPPSSIGGTSFQTGPMNSLVSPPSGGGGGFPVSLFPWLDKLPGLITGGGGGGGGGQQQPQQPSQPGQQPQQPGVGKLLAALPMLAAFQGGTTTTPAPYAHLGPHTPVAPTFKPQGRGNPIPSIGQLLAGVR